MTVHTAPARHPFPIATAAAGPIRAGDDGALDEALDHIGELAERLWAVRRLHAPARRRSAFDRGRVRCSGCGQALPCPTLRAADPR